MNEHVEFGHRAGQLHTTPASRNVSHKLVLVAWSTFGLAVIFVLSELLSGPAYRLGWIELKPGLQTMRWAATAEAVVFVIALFGALVAVRKQVPQAKVVFLLSTIIGFLAAAPPAVLWYRVQHLPHIHDVSTDTANPPEYIAVLPLRNGVPNSTVFDFKLASLQVQAYPDVRTVILTAPRDQTFQKALQVAHDMGWKIVDANQDTLRIEATDTSFLFGFKDDVVIRINGSGSESRIDLRSLSRVGGSDFGVNANRIRRFISRLKEATV